MVQEEDGERQIESPLNRIERPFDEACIRQAGGILAGLADRRGGQIDAPQFPDVRREQDLGVADAAAQAQHSRRPRVGQQAQQALHHVRPQGPDCRTRKVPLREAGVKLFVISQLALQYFA